MKTIPERHAELSSPEDVHEDILSLTALGRQCAEQRAYKILEKPAVRKTFDKLISSGVCTNEEEAIERALKAVLTAATP